MEGRRANIRPTKFFIFQIKKAFGVRANSGTKKNGRSSIDKAACRYHDKNDW